MLTFAQAIVLGVLPGTPSSSGVSSLGHSVILPQLLGWTAVVAAQSATAYCLAFLVGLHAATALALLFFYRSTSARIRHGLLESFFGQRGRLRVDANHTRPTTTTTTITTPSASVPLNVKPSSVMARRSTVTSRRAVSRPSTAAAGGPAGAAAIFPPVCNRIR
jgi:undecaprenyl pyrophosphate phosphatase UppP